MKGILFKPEMIQAIIEGRKTQTRRVIKPQPECECKDSNFRGQDIDWIGYKHQGKRAFFCFTCGAGLHHIDEFSAHGILPRYQVGEVVYIKEAWNKGHDGQDPILFKLGLSERNLAELDGDELWNGWQSPMSLKAEDARYFIEITDVRAERLQEITPYDAEAEGFAKWGLEHNCSACETESHSFYGGLYHFKEIWNSINKEKWESSPWVWVYTFKRSNNV